MKRAGVRSYRPAHAPVLLIEEARERLERMLGAIGSWSALSRFLPADWSGGTRRRSGLASTLLACLELARDGKLEMRQLKPFDEIYIRDRDARAARETLT
jgi:segregation and condensation protein A